MGEGTSHTPGIMISSHLILQPIQLRNKSQEILNTNLPQVNLEYGTFAWVIRMDCLLCEYLDQIIYLQNLLESLLQRHVKTPQSFSYVAAATDYHYQHSVSESASGCK